jgi:hypothetical protein
MNAQLELDLDLEYEKLALEFAQERAEAAIAELKKESTMGEFKSWGSTTRENKNKTITEKIDGTNACIVIYNGVVAAQSRKRIITPDDDNFGFAKWVYDNAGALMDTLGYGYHYGEWYGEGIQKNPLGIEGKRFALFHATKYTEGNGFDLDRVDGLETVPLLHHGQCDVWTIPGIMQDLEMYGSKVKGAKEEHVNVEIPGLGEVAHIFRAATPEGIIIWNNETRTRTKMLLKDDAFHKWEVKA